MEPNKLETDFRDKLNKREIQPSESAWDRLDAMLTVAEETKPRSNYNWLYLAASIIGFLFIGTIFFSQTEELIDVRNNNVVFENKEINKPIEETIQEKIPTTNPLPIKSESLVFVSNNKNIKSNVKELIVKSQNPIAKNPKTDILNTIGEQINPLNQDKVIIDEQIANVGSSSKNEIPKTAIKVNANTLLSQVDGELDLTFREKVLKKIDKNYKSVKIALANRNNQ